MPTVKTGTGRELRQLHDLVSQRLCSLRTAKEDSFESFLSSLIEMKLDQATKFTWQQHTHERKDVHVPSIDELLELVDWRAQASELSTHHEAERKYSTVEEKTNYGLRIKSPQNKSARHAMRLLIHCTQHHVCVYNIPGTSARRSLGYCKKARTMHELFMLRTLRQPMPVVSEMQKVLWSTSHIVAPRHRQGHT